MLEGATTIAALVPLFALAGSAVAFVWQQHLERRLRRNSELFELMQFLDVKGTLASKLAAVYRLRDFPEHGEFITRFCRAVAENTEGTAASALKQELLSTANHYEQRR